ncbi:MAG: hypothetical protein ACFFAS_21120 [Promethearchaeota archaeon]
MNIQNLIKLINKAAECIDDFKKGAVGSNGYGFVFKDLNSNLPYVIRIGSSKVCGAGTMRDFIKNFYKNYNNIENLEDLNNNTEYDEEYDLFIAGALKTLVPTLQFGGYELLFHIWMLVKTADDKIFPAILYYGQSGMSIGGWDLVNKKDVDNKYFPKEFEEIINFSPFQFSDNDINTFLDALEFALKKVPVSDFWGVYGHDYGNTLMGIYKGKPFKKNKGHYNSYPNFERKLKKFLNRKLIDAYGKHFTIKRIPEIKMYYIDFGYGHLTSNCYGDSEEIYKTFKEIITPVKNNKFGYTTISIPTSLIKEIQEKIKGTEFTSINSYINYILKQI